MFAPFKLLKTSVLHILAEIQQKEFTSGTKKYDASVRESCEEELFENLSTPRPGHVTGGGARKGTAVGTSRGRAVRGELDRSAAPRIESGWQSIRMRFIVKFWGDDALLS